MNTKANTQELANTKLTAYLTGKKMRKTPERYEVLRVITQTKGLFTVDELAGQMKEKAAFQVSRATLFNVLEMLADAGLVVKHAFMRAAQYESNIIPRPLICIRCLQCGKFEKAEIPQLEEALKAAKSRKLTISQQIVYLSGTCRKCEAQERKNKKKQERTKHKDT